MTLRKVMGEPSLGSRAQGPTLSPMARSKSSPTKQKSRLQRTMLSGSISVNVSFKQVKLFNLRVSSTGVVSLSAPFRVTLAEVQSFLDAHAEWIAIHVCRATAEKNLRLADDIRPGGTVQLWGKLYKLNIGLESEVSQHIQSFAPTLEASPDERMHPVVKLRITSDATCGANLLCTAHVCEQQEEVLIGTNDIFWQLAADAQAVCLERIVSHLRVQELKNALPRISEHAEARTGLHALRWSVRDMKSRWGSCTPASKSIRLSSRLASYPENCAVYVAIHELCHLIERSHNARFHSLVEAACPSWKELRAHLDGGRTS